MVRRDEAVHVRPRPVRGVQGRRANPLLVVHEEPRRGERGESAARDEERRDARGREAPVGEAAELDEPGEPGADGDREDGDHVLHVAVRDDDPGRGRGPEGGGEDEAEEPSPGLQAVAGEVHVLVTIEYTDDFNQSRTITKTLTLNVIEMEIDPSFDPNNPDGGGYIPVEQTETFLQKIWRFILGLFGLDSSVPVDNQFLPGDNGPIMPEPIPAEPGGKG